MQIAVGINNNKDVKILPVTPADMQIDYPILTETRDSLKYGEILVVKTEGLATVDIKSFFPTKEGSYLQPGSTANGWDYVKWFRNNRKNRKLMRVVITNSKGREYFNRLCFCENFQVTGIDQNGDIQYTMQFKQFRKG